MRRSRGACFGWCTGKVSAATSSPAPQVVSVTCPPELKWSPTPEALGAMCAGATRGVELRLDLGAALAKHRPFL